MSSPSSKRITRQSLKRSREDETGDKVEIKRKKKVDNRMMEEESDKIMFEWKTLQKLWKKKKQESMSSETQKGAKVDIQSTLFSLAFLGSKLS